jgi:hypothetical protein
VKLLAAILALAWAVPLFQGTRLSATDFPRPLSSQVATFAQLSPRDSYLLNASDSMEAKWKREEILRNAKRSDQSSDKLPLIVVPLLLIIAVIGVLRLRDF